MGLEAGFDAVIVGAGPGGAATAWRLCANGLKVLMLEAGPRFDPNRDYPLTTPDWERRGFPTPPGSRGEISYGDLGELSAEHDDLASWNILSGKPTRGAAGNRPRQSAPDGYGHVQGVGGTSLHFVGEAHRLNRRNMRLATDFGAGADWPIGYDDIEPHYSECEAIIGVAGVSGDDRRWRSRDHLQPPHPLSPPSLRLKAAGARIGMTWHPNARAALSRPLNDRPACNYCGNCFRGCPIGDKGSCDVTFIRMAEATGNLRIETGAQVTRINVAPTGRVESLIYAQGGGSHRQETPLLVLAAGAVQTPRLLLASASREFPDGIANGSRQVGRNFMETLHWTSTGLLDGLRNSHMGLPADAISWTYNDADAIPGAIGGCRFASATQEIGLVGPIAYATRLIGGFGAAFKRDLRAAFGTAISVGAIGETIPDRRSFVDLHPERVDTHGVALPRINSVLTDNSLKILRFMAEKSRRLLREAGVREIREEFGNWDQFSSPHVFGTCRMGHDSDVSVVAPNGRTHDIANLYIADASTFPSSGGGEAPSLTIQALALRLADAILHG